MALGRGFSVRSAVTAVSAADDLIQVTAPSTMIVVIDRIVVTQGTVTAVEIKQLIGQRASAAGTGGALTPEEQEPGGPAASSTWLSNATTNATLAGAPYIDEQWNFLLPFVWHPKEGKEIVVPPSGIFVVRLNEAPAGAMDFNTYIDFREIG